ncbi:MAG TPA: Uma2 family endonuclease [Gemmataceae bacterium]|nr:Uma2 family endonuclease [Gemmataceae bacterium]
MNQATVSESVTPLAPLADSDDSLYEVVNGQRVEKPFMSIYGIRLTFVLATYLEAFVKAHQLGRVVIEAIFALPLPRGLQQRRPDAAFVSYQRWAKNRPLPHTDPWHVVPDLAIEAVSKSNPAEEIIDKIQEYFEAGVQLVWVVYPRQRLVYVYESPERVQVLTQAHELDGRTTLPGFKLSIAAIFEDDDETPASRNP